jgi:hypothetical protein
VHTVAAHLAALHRPCTVLCSRVAVGCTAIQVSLAAAAAALAADSSTTSDGSTAEEAYFRWITPFAAGAGTDSAAGESGQHQANLVESAVAQQSLKSRALQSTDLTHSSARSCTVPCQLSVTEKDVCTGMADGLLLLRKMSRQEGSFPGQS